jgi:hypothetical protein
MLFPHRHPQASPAFHIAVIDMWRSADEFVSIEAFREGAKTTLSEEFLLTEALFKNFNYLLIFGETYTKACQRIAAMKHELVTNMKIYNLFGKQTGGAAWAENKIILPNGVCIEAHGWEEEIRGYKHLHFRPDRAYLDDIENKTSVKDTATVTANWNKLYIELIPAMDKDKRKIRITGTPLADDCMMARARRSEQWVSGVFPICDGDIDNPATQALWPERYPMSWIRETRDRMAAEGFLTGFNQEYMLVGLGATGKPFTEEMLRFEDIAPRMYAPRKVVMDPARTVEVKTSDQSGYVVASKIGTRIYVHESGGKYWQPDEIVTGAFELSAKYDEAEVSIEKNSLDNWLLQPIRARMLLTGHTLKMKTLNAPQDRDKAQFIMGLRPFFMAGDIILVGGRAAHPQLVSQILNFPSGKKDILNALAYVPRIFSGIPIYGDFADANIYSGGELARDSVLLLGCNSTGTETTAVLCSLNGPFLTVLADWISPLLPNDAIPDIAMLIRATFPGRKVTAWVPGDVFDQVGRNPLMAALKLAGYKANRGDHSSMNRSSLSPMIRTETRGRRMFMVDSQARHTMQALACGYNWQVKADGQRDAEPERGPERTLIEGLEVLTFAINKSDNAISGNMANSYNTMGQPYMSALGNKR